MAIFGKSGVGKTTLMRNMVVADLEAGNGLTVVDPHGSLIEDLLGAIPRNRGYNTGARVSEMTELQRHQVKFGVKSFVQFMGKGRKERAVPLWPTTTRALQAWFKEVESDKRNGAAAFPNARGNALSRDGVNYLLQECVGRAIPKCPSLAGKRISPHVFRHSAAMHLLQAGVDITVIALWLGHESIQTTHGYIEADLATKEQVLEQLAPAGKLAKRFKADDDLLRFLATL